MWLHPYYSDAATFGGPPSLTRYRLVIYKCLAPHPPLQGTDWSCRNVAASPGLQPHLIVAASEQDNLLENSFKSPVNKHRKQHTTPPFTAGLYFPRDRNQSDQRISVTWSCAIGDHLKHNKIVPIHILFYILLNPLQ